MHHLHGFQIAALAVLGVCVWAFMFIVWWALVGWGVSIAARVYFWAMRNHQPYEPYRPARRSWFTPPVGADVGAEEAG
jgi:hypothetical protein